MPDGPDVASRRAVLPSADQRGSAALGDRGGAHRRRRCRGGLPGGCAPTGDPGRQQLSAYPGCPFDDETDHGEPLRHSAERRASRRSTSISTAAKSRCDVVAADDIGHVIHPILAEGQVVGGSPGDRLATVEEIEARDGRYRNDLLATTSSRPRSTHRGYLDPRRGAVQRAAAPGAAGVGELPMDVGAPAGRRRDPRCHGGLGPRSAGLAGANPRIAGAKNKGRPGSACDGGGSIRRVRADAPIASGSDPFAAIRSRWRSRHTTPRSTPG